MSLVAPPVQIEAVSHRYGQRLALDQVSLTADSGELLALLGPNGGGKTTLFRLLATLVAPQQGRVTIAGSSLPTQANAAREHLGVVFQAPSLDRMLTVGENLLCQGRLYGLSGADLRSRARASAERLGVADRWNDLAGALSGGLRRRAELAKSLLHNPSILLMDEPSTGLDPAARLDLWRYVGELQAQQRMTVLFTTHLLDEAERADRVGVLDAGRVVALGAPGALKAELGGDVIVLQAVGEARRLADAIVERYDEQAAVVDDRVRIGASQGRDLLARILVDLGDEVAGASIGPPSLEDVFIARTGRQFWGDGNREQAA